MFCIKNEFLSKFYFFILYVFSLSHGATSLVPDASQEGSLHAFKSYSDVATFHYTVPKEVLRATWQFAAFMDGKNCIPRKVHIYLQSGSYPIINANNATFPSHMNSERNNTIRLSTMTTYDAKTTAVVPVNSPEPGDWFVGAYMSHWDEKVQQQGLGHKCRYSIGSVAIWLQTNGMQTIPMGYKKKMRTMEPSNYYKIYIPSGTWHFRVTISGCKPVFRTSNETSDLCIRGLALEGRVLPIFNHTHECPVKITENMFLRPLTIGNVSSRRNNYRVQKTVFEPSDEDEIISDDPCVRRFQLVRVKQLQTFSGVYLFQGREWLTPWIMLSDSSLVIAQFDVLPLIDVGGTLDITIHLETDKLMTKQLVTIKACVKQGRKPDRINGDVRCPDKAMQLNLSSNDRRGSNLLIPYPQPDTWYITLQARCSFNGFPVHCESTEILVSLDVHTRPCVFSGLHSCGPYGVCQEIHKGLLHYTTCNCFGGYRGWGCTDSTGVNPRVSIFLSSFLLTFSNGFFLPAIYIAAKRRLFTEGLVYSATMLFSSLYHACDQQFMTYCIAKYEVLQYCDFFSSILAFWVTLVAMAKLPIQLVSVCHMFGVLIIAFGVESDRTGLSSILVPLAIGIMIPISAFFFRYYESRKLRRPKNLWKLLTGLSLASLGLVIFVSVETESNYDYVHSVWHMLIALSLVFLLPSVRKKRVTSLNDNSPSGSDSELIDYKNPPGSPVFTIESSEDYLTISAS
ncbi:transmembrane protein 8B-like isoform X2 [Venturia canescens]|uniref:transmembrane protein 8B-like isoform X2 n=1 Tax=Venturia canescens TaxID=32260 RepID=UPI001C9CB5EC|nr:transmembrane protein 8B-like isoform X2 [Venturia canescens]